MSPYIVLLQVLLLVGLSVLQVFVDGCDLPLLIVDGLVQRLQLFLDPLVSLLLGGELATTTLLGIQVGPLLGCLGQSGRKLSSLASPSLVFEATSRVSVEATPCILYSDSACRHRMLKTCSSTLVTPKSLKDAIWHIHKNLPCPPTYLPPDHPQSKGILNVKTDSSSYTWSLPAQWGP